MPQIYIYGSSPTFAGFTFSTASQLLNKIAGELVNAGWTITNDSITASNFFIARGVTTNGHNCWIKFTTSTVSGTQQRLTIRGDLDGANTTLMTDGVVYLDFDSSLTNFLYLPADQDSGAICILSGDAAVPVRSAHFGFLDRVDTSNQWAIMVGHLISWNTGTHFIAKSSHAAVNWQRFSADRENGALLTDANSSSALQIHLEEGQQDIACHALTLQNTSRQLNSISNVNWGYFSTAGQVNGSTNKPLLSPYYLREGRNGTTNYGSSGGGGTKAGFNLAPKLYFPGVVKHCWRGAASLLEGEQILPPEEITLTSSGTSPLSLGRTEVISVNSVKSAGGVTYTEGVDFTVNLAAGTVTPTSGGAIASGTSLIINFNSQIYLSGGGIGWQALKVKH